MAFLTAMRSFLANELRPRPRVWQGGRVNRRLTSFGEAAIKHHPMRAFMRSDNTPKANVLRHRDFSTRDLADLNDAERAEMNRRYENFMRHFRAGAVARAPSGERWRRIRKWRP
jgi:hypothetical protein